jgi:ketosteroid isomerase-like protein
MDMASCTLLSEIDRQTFPGLLSDTFMSGVAIKLYVPVIVSAPMDRKPRLSCASIRLFAIALVLAVCCNMVFAGQPKIKKHENRREIEQLEEAWCDAVLKSDTTALSSLLADDYIAITASGTLQTKDEALANLRNHRVHFTALNISDRKLRFYGNTALVTSLASVEATTPEGDIAGNYRYTRVYVRDEQDRWKIVSFEASHIRQPGEHREPSKPRSN